jgi:adenine-specific DNA-methyltransferase
MYPRLVLLRELLAEDGSIWVSIDDREAHYLKVLMDEVFGRGNFVTNVVWEKVYTPKSNGRGLSGDHDHVLVFSKSPMWLESGWNMLPRNEEQQGRFKNPDNDPEGPWRTYPLDVRTEDDAKREKYRYEIVLPSGRVIKPSQGRHWALPKDEFEKQRIAGDIYFGKDGNAMPTKKMHLKNAKQGVIARTWWAYKEVGGNQDAKREVLALFGDSGFITPKPESLLHRVLTIATNPGDLVLDSFLGSGTTAAVAHKMGRRWIGIEMGGHAVTHCLPRLQKVIEGEQGGISQSVNWQGGGGFRFHTLGEPVFDADGGIHPAVRFKALAAFLWHFETGEPAAQAFDQPLLGTHNGTAYFLLYNGILGDRRPQGGNVLTSAVLAHLEEQFPHDGPRVIYGETTRLGEARLREAGITFKQIPYDIKAR